LVKTEETGLRGALAACRNLIAWAILFSAGINLLYLAPSLYMMQVYDRVLNTGGMMTLALLSGVVLFALAILGFLDMSRSRLGTRLSLRLNRIVGPTVIALGFARPGKGSDATRVNAARDFDTLRQVYSSPGAIAVLDTPWTLVFVGVCFVIHPWIGGLTLLGAIVLLLIALRHEAAIRPALTEAAELAPRYYKEQEGDRSAGEAVRALGMRGVLVDRQLSRRNEMIGTQTKATFTQTAYGSMSRFWRLVLQSAVLGLGAYLAVERQISPGALIAGSILAARALAPLEQVVGGWRQIEQARIAYRNLIALIDDAEQERDHTALPLPRGELSLEGVAVRNPGVDKYALQRITFNVSPGEILCVVGPSGAGKSTLARTAVGALRADVGTVRLDGASLVDWDQDALGVHLGYLPQDISLLPGTVAENIRRFAPPSPESDALTVAAARAAGAHDMILRLNAAYDTQVGIAGRGVSLGQAQRIALARALYRNPKVLVFDEPNAHLDGEGELALIQSLKDAAARGTTVLLVAHKPTLIAVADRLLFLRDGMIEAIGPRDEVARKFMRLADSSGNLAPIRQQEAQR
jgi:ATP-binding cassette, subfamily C, bacterial exporter for protease/lipase